MSRWTRRRAPAPTGRPDSDAAERPAVTLSGILRNALAFFDCDASELPRPTIGQGGPQ